MTTCKWEGCDRAVAQRGYCSRCYQRAVKRGLIATKKHTSRGLSGLPEYYIWAAMKRRCFYPKDKCYHLYGGRGITVCQEWRDSFEPFYAHMGPRPTPRHQLDRIDPNGNYEPGNCRWATPEENAQNTRDCVLDPDKVRLIRNSPLTGYALAKLMGITQSTISLVRRRKQWKNI